MNHLLFELERRLAERFAKFQPHPEPDGLRFGNEPTRLYLEYDETLAFVERRPGCSEIVDVGVIETAERDLDARGEAA